MSDIPKVLFHGIPDHTTEADLTAGPPSGKVWTVTALWIANTDSVARTLTLKHYIDASNTRTIVPGATFAVKQTEIIGPLVIENGHKVIAEQEEENAIEITAYGLEGDA